MFIDASALVAILNEEEDADYFEERISASRGREYFSDIVLFEAVQAVARVRAAKSATTLRFKPHLIDDAYREVSAFLQDMGALHVAITARVGAEAIIATRTYGKTVAHKAALNLGDCYSYGCAKALSVPLLYKGLDFAQTDLA